MIAIFAVQAPEFGQCSNPAVPEAANGQTMTMGNRGAPNNGGGSSLRACVEGTVCRL